MMTSFITNDIKKSIQEATSLLDVLKGKKILITGGTGFVGGWVARTLAWLNDEENFGCHIILLARTPDKLEQVDSKLLLRKDVTFLSSDVRSLGELPKNVNYVIHAAASPDNREHMSNPVNTMDVIAMGTKSILEAALRLADIEGIVHISSGQVYSETLKQGGTLSETTAGGSIKSSITSIYPEAKRYAETICFAYSSQYKLPINIVRPFSFIGPYQSLNKPWAVNSFIQEALSKQPIRIIGNGEPQRSYMYASDMAVWMLVILANGERGSIYNVGSAEAISLHEVANKVNAIVPHSVDLIIENYNSDASKFIPNVDLAVEQLGVQNMFKFDEALEHTIRWNLEHLENRDIQ